MTEQEIYKKAIFDFGKNAQICQTQEECAELIVALAHFMRDRCSSLGEVIEEIADVEIMLEQLKLIIGEGATDRVLAIKQEKLHRLAGLLGVEYDA